MDVSFWATTFAQALKVTARWAAEQSRSEALFAALLEFHGRWLILRAGPELPAFGPGSGLEDAPSLLLARHARSLENLLAALRACGRAFEVAYSELAELHAAVWQRHGALGDDSAGTTERQQRADDLLKPGWGMAGAGRGRDAQRVCLPDRKSVV